MFKKLFSSTLIIFAFAISLIVLTQTESNAQVIPGVCGTCGLRDCYATFINGRWIYSSYEALYEIEAETPTQPNVFIASSVYVWEGCLACLNPETGEETLVDETIAGSTAQFYSPAEELQTVGDGSYTLTQEVCATVVEEVCGECDGKVSELTLRYDGDLSPAHIVVYQHKIDEAVFEGDIYPGEFFTFSGMDKWDTLGPKINVSGDNNTMIHTSCSDPIGPGLVSGDFTVMSGYSRNGGLLCPLDGSLNGSECIDEEFNFDWDLPVNPVDVCAIEGFTAYQLRVQRLSLTGRILACALDPDGNPYLDDDGQPDYCAEDDIICLYCQTDEACETWDDDGEVNYVCEEISCQGSLEVTAVTGTVIRGEDDDSTYAWPVPDATISSDNIEFIDVKTNSTISADFTSNRLILKYENTSNQANITSPPLTYTFEFDDEIISAVNLLSHTFSQDIIMSYTSDSITLEVQMQNKNPGEIFTVTYELIF